MEIKPIIDAFALNGDFVSDRRSHSATFLNFSQGAPQFGPLPFRR
jgi:hypothetical protein